MTKLWIIYNSFEAKFFYMSKFKNKTSLSTYLKRQQQPINIFKIKRLLGVPEQIIVKTCLDLNLEYIDNMSDIIK